MRIVNLLAIVALSAGLMVGATVIALSEGDPPAPAGTSELDLLIHRLADDDAAVWQDAAEALRRRGAEAVPALEAAARGPDAPLAVRARQLLDERAGGVE